jgi:hypothetical protein
MGDKVVEFEGQVADKIPPESEMVFATEEELCDPGKPKFVQLNSGNWLKYRPSVPVVRMAELQQKSLVKGRVDRGKLAVLTAVEVLLKPRLSKESVDRLIRGGNSAIIFGLFSEVSDYSIFRKQREELGE